MIYAPRILLLVALGVEKMCEALLWAAMLATKARLVRASVEIWNPNKGREQVTVIDLDSVTGNGLEPMSKRGTWAVVVSAGMIGSPGADEEPCWVRCR